MSSSPSEHFGWPEYMTDAETYWDAKTRAALRADEAYRLARREIAERQREAYFSQGIGQLVADLERRGLLREDRFSYSRTTYLEWETGIATGSPEEHYLSLREAERKDMERG